MAGLGALFSCYIGILGLVKIHSLHKPHIVLKKKRINHPSQKKHMDKHVGCNNYPKIPNLMALGEA